MSKKLNNRLKMYMDYKRELCKMDGVDGLRSPEEDYIRGIKSLLDHPEAADWVPIMYNNREVGFLLVITHERLLHNGEDYRIEETYVMPKYRRKGLMSKAVKKYFREHHGRYSMQLMNTNLNATLFWFPIIGKRLEGNMIRHDADDGTFMLEVFFTIDDNWVKEKDGE